VHKLCSKSVCIIFLSHFGSVRNCWHIWQRRSLSLGWQEKPITKAEHLLLLMGQQDPA